jgi:hypothetical protein
MVSSAVGNLFFAEVCADTGSYSAGKRVRRKQKLKILPQLGSSLSWRPVPIFSYDPFTCIKRNGPNINERNNRKVLEFLDAGWRGSAAKLTALNDSMGLAKSFHDLGLGSTKFDILEP